MLWYKAWLETRARFLISLLGITTLCSYSIVHGDEIGLALSYTRIDYYYSILHSAHTLLAVMWVLAVTLLMMGGLLREKSVGAASFTLSLPVGRARLMSTRIGMGLIQAITLIVVPWGAMFLMGSITGKTHSVSQAFFHIVLLTGGGLVFFALAVLMSSLVEGEYTAPVVSYGVVLAIAVGFSGSFRAYSPFAFIMGSEYLDRNTSLLAGRIPWTQFSCYLFLAALLVIASVKLTQKREF